MDDALHRLFQMTKEAVDRLDHVTAEELIQFVQDRESVVKEVKQNASHTVLDMKSKQMIASIVAMDKQLESKIVNLKSDVGRKISALKLRRKTFNQYNSPYIADSFFFDRKK